MLWSFDVGVHGGWSTAKIDTYRLHKHALTVEDAAEVTFYIFMFHGWRSPALGFSPFYHITDLLGPMIVYFLSLGYKLSLSEERINPHLFKVCFCPYLELEESVECELVNHLPRIWPPIRLWL
jgi:hypothetical protein